ncbi:GGDEF domain-containing protein [Rhodospirillum rubrum]|uniref:sensor domain-containing protein n=1 Tax=Rhodospirillum rubrum TaxID=1085 RepID=UPI00190446C6|nr:EAL domain-containing protein [Rhodospirillum rubrum]MBK1676459.1 GGDEF domain-containing protein [Rhodospirillum rubrum]
MTSGVAPTPGIVSTLSAAAEAVSEALIALDADGGILVVNGAAERVFDRRRDDLIGRSLDAVFGEDFAEAMASNLSAKVDAGGGGRLLRRPGLPPLALHAGFSVTGDHGRPLATIVIRDLSPRADSWLETEERLGGFAASMPGIIFQRVAHRDGSLSYPFLSSGVHAVLGYHPAEMSVALDGCLNAIHWADRESYLHRLRQSAQSLAICSEEFRAITREGAVKWLSGASQPRAMANGDILWDGVLVDITERKRAELWLEMIMDRAADGIVTINEQGVIESANAAVGTFFGYADRGELIGRRVEILMAAADRRQHTRHMLRYRETGEGALIGAGPRELTGRRRDGTTFALELALSEVRTEGRRIFIAVIRDITQRKETEGALAATRARLQTIADNVPGLVFQRELTAEGVLRFLFVSNGVREVLGITPEALLADGELFLAAMDPDVRAAFRETLRQSASRLEPMEEDIKLRGRDGEERWLRGWSRPSPRQDGSVVWDGVTLDVTDRKRAEDKLTFLAYYDPLTGLGNRSLFVDRFDRARRFAESIQAWMAVLSIGLDRFGMVNATIGHTMGDKVLIAVTRRLQQSLDTGSIVCRAGGDRFLVLLSGLTDRADLGEAVATIQDAFVPPIEVEGQQFDIGLTIGGALHPEDGREAETLIMHADAALHRAKGGGGAFQMFTPEMGARAAHLLTIQHKLRRGLERHEFVAYFQPQVDLRSGLITGCEALARWNSPEDGLVPPGKFIGVAEEYGLIDAICGQVLDDTCRWLSTWRARGLPQVPVAVNISGRQFQNARQLVAMVDQALRQSGVDPRLLELELTESSAMSDPENAIAVVNLLRERGVSCAIDDFGTGYSSLSVLKRFPIGKLKIDRSFVMDVTTDPNDAAIVQAIIAMAHALNLRVVAEGVETLDHLAFLREVHCDAVQGFLFARPLPGEDMALMLAGGPPQPNPR